MSTYLVTGVAGFIGSNLAEALLARGDTVRGIDNFVTGKRDTVAGLKGLDFIEGEITSADTMKRVLRGVDYVLHEAALPSVPRSVAEPVLCNHANVNGTLTVLEAARHARSVKRLVYAASSSAYGDTTVLPKVETLAPRPRSPYAVQKLTGEHYATVYSMLYELPCVSLRYFNVFGPRQDPESQYAAVVPKFILAALKGESPPVFGDGMQSRDFTFVGNVVEANLKACSAAGVAGEMFNVACGERHSLLDLLAMINEAAGSNVTPRFFPARPGDVKDSLADISKARKMLGYTAGVSVKDGLQRTLAWYKTRI
ncbi:MAG: SDR family oxidoreductase [Deltaproteobacteria bacterium]|nr:SDR family oxidoreductase [Deltaproteobacteria bacterium]